MKKMKKTMKILIRRSTNSATTDDEDTVEVSKDQMEDLVEDKEAFDKEFERFMSTDGGP